MKLNFLKQLKDALFPTKFTCDLCGLEIFDGNLCADCLKTVTFNNKTTCPLCGRKTVRPEICIECKAKAPKFKKATSPIVFTDGGIKLVKRFKDGYPYLKEYFADLIAEKLADFPAFDCIICVPMTKKALRRRGYDQVKLLARALSKRINIPVLENAVIKTKDAKTQKELTRREREQNIAGCFEVKDKQAVKEKSVLILDDVLTTGATADEMSKILLSAGAKTVYLATVASVEYKVITEEMKKAKI